MRPRGVWEIASRQLLGTWRYHGKRRLVTPKVRPRRAPSTNMKPPLEERLFSFELSASHVYVEPKSFKGRCSKHRLIVSFCEDNVASCFSAVDFAPGGGDSSFDVSARYCDECLRLLGLESYLFQEAGRHPCENRACVNYRILDETTLLVPRVANLEAGLDYAHALID